MKQTPHAHTMSLIVRIERPSGYVEIFENGIIHFKTDEGTRITESMAQEDVALCLKYAKEFPDRPICLIHDIRGRITTDRGARRAYGTFDHPNAYIALIINSAIVEVALNFVLKRYPANNRVLRAFRDFESAWEWVLSIAGPLPDS